MTLEEMLAMYEVAIEPALIITFYGVALITILLAVGTPIWMYVRRKPKSILYWPHLSDKSSQYITLVTQSL